MTVVLFQAAADQGPTDHGDGGENARVGGLKRGVGVVEGEWREKVILKLF